MFLVMAEHDKGLGRAKKLCLALSLIMDYGDCPVVRCVDIETQAEVVMRHALVPSVISEVYFQSAEELYYCISCHGFSRHTCML